MTTSTASKRAGKGHATSIRPVDRQRMTPWLYKLLETGDTPGLCWLDGKSNEFQIKWCHGSRHGWSRNDAGLFELWAKHTGRYDKNKEDPRKWKANFRCALNSLKDVQEVKNKSNVKGSNPYKIFRFTSAPCDKIPAVRETYRSHAVQINRKLDTPSSSETDASLTSIKTVTMTPGLLTTPNLSSTTYPFSVMRSLPNFEKIAPGLGTIEFGKKHCLPLHNSGFTVFPGDQKQPELQPIPFSFSLAATTISSDVTTSQGYSDESVDSPDGNEDVELCVYEIDDDCVNDLDIAATLVVKTVDGQLTAVEQTDDGQFIVEQTDDVYMDTHDFINFEPLTPPDSN